MSSWDFFKRAWSVYTPCWFWVQLSQFYDGKWRDMWRIKHHCTILFPTNPVGWTSSWLRLEQSGQKNWGQPFSDRPHRLVEGREVNAICQLRETRQCKKLEHAENMKVSTGPSQRGLTLPYPSSPSAPIPPRHACRQRWKIRRGGICL